jgi:hypothetical protein
MRRSRQAIAIVSRTLSKNKLTVLGAAYVGVLSDERGQPSGRFNPRACFPPARPDPAREQAAVERKEDFEHHRCERFKG